MSLPQVISVAGRAYLAAAIFITALVATAFAWLHHFVVRRLTFALFRIYVTAVVAGLGSVFGWALSWWLQSQTVRYAWALSLGGMLWLTVCFGWAAYRGARHLRGAAPRSLSWLTKEEFAGSWV